MGLDLAAVNRELREQSPEAAIRWALRQESARILTSTNFGPHEAIILHMVTREKPDMPILWADSGYNTPATYRFADRLIRQLGLRMHIYTPLRSRAYREAVLGGIPDVSDEAQHAVFTEEVKLEPFRRGLAELRPRVWITAIRKEQTEFRQSLDTVTLADQDLLRVSPLFHWTEAQLEAYAREHDLPVETDYFDPTKVFSNRECGLHPSYFQRKSA
jgi:phosphoadenosine phosphosulfate reductase